MVTNLSHGRVGQASLPISMGSPYASALGRQPVLSTLSSFGGPPPVTSPRLQAMGTPALSSPTLSAASLGSAALNSPAMSPVAFAGTGVLSSPAMSSPAMSSTRPASSSGYPAQPYRSGREVPISAPRSFEVPVSPPQLPSPRPPVSQPPELLLQDKLKSPRGERNSADSQAFIDGTTGLRGCSLTLPKYSKRLQDGSVERTSAAYNEYDNVFDGVKPDSSRTDMFKAMDIAQARDRSSSPRSRVIPLSSANAWAPAPVGQKPLALSRQPSGVASRQISPMRLRDGPRRGTDKCHTDLYEDASARQQRLKEMRQHVEQVQEREEQKRLENHAQSMKEWRRLYKLKDTRSQAQREEEMLKKRKEKQSKKEEMERERELNELQECTFRPVLRKKPSERGRSPRGMRPSENPDPPPGSLQQLLERQRNCAASLQELSVEDLHLREHLSTVHAEYHDRIQREETQRVVVMLQDADTEGSAQRDLIDRVRRMVAAGEDPEVAQRQIVEELVARSQDEVKRRVLDAFGPIQLEAEGKLYHKRLSLVHELESVEAQVVALRGGTLVAEAREMGFEFGLAEKSRRTLPAVPVLSAMRMTTGDADVSNLSAGHFRAHSTSSSNQTPRHSPRLMTDRSLMRPSTPRSQAATSDGASRQSSGQQPSLSGSVLQPSSEKGERAISADIFEAAVRSNSPVTLQSSAEARAAQQATSSSVPLRTRIASAPPNEFAMASATGDQESSRPHSSSVPNIPADSKLMSESAMDSSRKATSPAVASSPRPVVVDAAAAPTSLSSMMALASAQLVVPSTSTTPRTLPQRSEAASAPALISAQPLLQQPQFSNSLGSSVSALTPPATMVVPGTTRQPQAATLHSQSATTFVAGAAPQSFTRRVM